MPIFVEFVEHEHGVHRTGAFHRVDDAAWHGTDICAAVTAYFGLVVESAERHSLVFTPQGMCDRFANRGLAHAGRANEAYNRRLAARVVHNQGKLLEYALFDLVEAVVVVFEYFACFFEVSYRCCLLMPRQLDQRVEIGVEHRVVGRRGVEAAQFLYFLLEERPHFLRHTRIFSSSQQVVDLVAAVAVEGLAYGLHLLLQEGVSLVLVHGLLGLVHDLASDFLTLVHHHKFGKQPLGAV